MTTPASRRRALLMVNRNARRGGDAIDPILGRLTRGGLRLTVEDMPEPDRLAELFHSHADDVDCVIVGGGDGTMNAVTQELVKTELPLGILPMGTANDLARTLGIGPTLEQAADVILAGEARRIDLGEVNGHVFLNLASLGYSVTLTRTLTKESKRRWGTLGYAIAALKILSQARPFTVYFEVDGVTRKARTLQVGVGNGKFYGGGMIVEENATLEDEKLDVYSLEFEQWWQLAGIVPAMRRGVQGKHPQVRSFSAKEVTIRTRRPHHVNADGEIVTRTPATFRVLPKAITVYAPPDVPQT
ncbi:lipid kinase [Methylobrevis pamukkalensis]|uniref:Putative lipid kinase BmrU n=1 Tax=Methylobrevis pamukkalensis TaxID=1439726 RepID=A0A1E3H748_9HYPH|nr:lipid kinase [Methylobrevis pamukkalensis]ODN71975.1 putative lipid kinase BmrU [Methylobrevis pamukkalensis]